MRPVVTISSAAASPISIPPAVADKGVNSVKASLLVRDWRANYALGKPAYVI
jgi:hypothetical protein